MYRERHVGPLAIPWYASPKIQLGMVAFVCFLCPGMFNALSGMGGGGKTDPTLSDNMVSLVRFLWSACLIWGVLLAWEFWGVEFGEGRWWVWYGDGGVVRLGLVR